MQQNSDSVRVGVPRETGANERRVALVPHTAAALLKAGFTVYVERGAGSAAGFSDEDYASAGVQLSDNRGALIASCELILQVQSPEEPVDTELRDKMLVAMCDPLSEPDAMAAWAAQNTTCFALELVPRITRAQSMDVLSSMATIAGYKAVLLAAEKLNKMFPMLMTAAGTVTPARVLIIGAGVAGLQAIATARRLGAVVSAYDVRPAVREQVESLGAKFVALELGADAAEDSGGYAKQMSEEFYDRQRQLMATAVQDSDVVITTAAVPGRQAPVLVTTDMVRAMPSGSVIVDLAAERGGNCELTQQGTCVEHGGVTILGPENLPASIPQHASEMFSRNIGTFVEHLYRDGRFSVDDDDEIVRETLVTCQGEVVHSGVRELLKLPDLNHSGDDKATV